MRYFIKKKITVDARVYLDESGAVCGVKLLTFEGGTEQQALVAQVEAESTKEERAAVFAKATSSRIKQGLVRVISDYGQTLRFAKLLRSTSAAHVLNMGSKKTELRFSRKTGFRVNTGGGGGAWGLGDVPQIHPEDLRALAGV